MMQSLAVPTALGPLECSKVPTSRMLMQAPTVPPAEALGPAGQPRGDTQYTSNTDYQKELQQLIEERGGVKSLLPGEFPAPSDKNVGLQSIKL